MKFKIVKNAWWLIGGRGMVLWPWMWLRHRKEDPRYPREQYEEWYQKLEDELYRHELQHCYQVHKLGRFKFYSKYLYLWVKHGYKNHPFEIEANARESDPLTDQERLWYERGWVVLD